MQLGWFPGVHIRQTSDEEYGQIYVPFVNWIMMASTVALTVGFGSSDRLAGAYGTAVSTTMLLTTVLLYRVMRERWGWWAPAALAIGAVFILVDFTLFAANLAKIRDGGWIPLAFGGLVFATMATWRYGTDALQANRSAADMAPEDFFKTLRKLKNPACPRHCGLPHAVGGGHAATDDPSCRADRRVAGERGRIDGKVCRCAARPAHRTPRGRKARRGRLADHRPFRLRPGAGFARGVAAGQTGGCDIDLKHAIFFHARDDVVAGRNLNLLSRARRSIRVHARTWSAGCRGRVQKKAPTGGGWSGQSQPGRAHDGWAHEPSTTYPQAPSAVCPLADKQFQAGL
jgi:KUP system potassium uptake protein